MTGPRSPPGEGSKVRNAPGPQDRLGGGAGKEGGLPEAAEIFSEVPVCRVEELAEADAIVFGTPSYLGNMAGQMRSFLDSTGDLWRNNLLVGKVGGVFVSSGSQHGGQEAAILAFVPTLASWG